MKKLFLLVMVLGIAIFANAQINAPKGIKVGKIVSGTNIMTIDSINQIYTDGIRFYKGATQLYPYMTHSYISDWATSVANFVTGTPWTSVGYWYSGSHPTTTAGYGLPAYPTTLPASDVSAWAKAGTKPTYTATEVGLGNVNNTSDANKPVSTAQQTALNLKANVADTVSATTIFNTKDEIEYKFNNLLGADSVVFNTTQRRFKYLSGNTWYRIAVQDSLPLASSLLTGIYGYYKLDEASGSIVDAIGTNAGTNSGAVPNQTGKLGTAYDFDTNTDYLYSTYTTTNGQFSLSLWFNLDIIPSTAARDYTLAGAFMADYSDVWRLFINSGNQIVFTQTNTIGSVITAASTEWLTTTTGAWYHIAVQSAPVGGKAKIYLNGADVTSTASDVFTGTAKAPNFRFYIGNMQGGSNAIDGKIDEVGLWTKAITPAENTSLYNSGTGKTHPFITW